MVEGLHRVVVTGLGAITPIGNTVKEYWDGLASGRNGVAAISLFDASAHACRFAAEVKDFDPTGILEPKESKRPSQLRSHSKPSTASGLISASSS